ncbi:hypothetical protein BD769DRAFT_1640355 [Suillus cothurnatus]|nr:hypothetical protein BD769DRAFT_1640355 [Suillus cothurnatus]
MHMSVLQVIWKHSVAVRSNEPSPEDTSIKISYANSNYALSANKEAAVSLSFYGVILPGERAGARWPGSERFACNGRVKVQMKSVVFLDAYRIRYYLKNDHPTVICTDHTLPFRTSCLGEYSLLLAQAAQPPLGLGLNSDYVPRVARMGMDPTFLRPRHDRIRFHSQSRTASGSICEEKVPARYL